MPYRIHYVPAALEHLRSLTTAEQRLVLDSVDQQLRDQPGVPTRNRKRLRPNPLAPWELRVGDLRVFYDIEETPAASEESVVVVLAVGVKKGNRLLIGKQEYPL